MATNSDVSTTNMPNHNLSSCLGYFSKLPLEIRRDIWSYCPVTEKDRPWENSMRLENFTAILRTSHCIREEAEESFYKNLTVEFDVDPVYEPESWLEVSINDCMYTSFTNARGPRINSFIKFLSHHMERVTISIQAVEEERYLVHQEDDREPNLDGADNDRSVKVADSVGQLLCLFRRCTDIASLLKQVPAGFLNLEIDFVDTYSGDWFSRYTETGEHSEAHFGPTFFKDYYGAFFVMLTAFNVIRGTRQAKILIPKHDRCLMEQAGDDIVEQYEDLLGPDRITVSHRLPTDEFLQEERDIVFLDLENMLDTASGPVARMLRLHRYAYWYDEKLSDRSEQTVSEYEAEIERIVFSSALTNTQRLLSAEAMCRRKLSLMIQRPRSGCGWFATYDSRGISEIETVVCDSLIAFSAHHQQFFKGVHDWILKRYRYIPPLYKRLKAGVFSIDNAPTGVWQLSGEARFQRGHRIQ